jgi:hypothetical protein
MDYHNHTRDRFENIHSDSTPVGDEDDVVSIGMWILLLILTAIPIVNIIALLFMAFGDHNLNIKNYGKASLIIVAIPLTLIILLR